MIDLPSYKQVILDFDGVLCDTNTIKEANIKKAVEPFTDRAGAAAFVESFTAANGMPRETKIAAGFEPGTARQVLDRYNKFNHETLLKVEFAPGALNLLLQCQQLSIPVDILSGGDQNEIDAILTHNQATHLFRKVMTGPRTKFQHLEAAPPAHPTLYCGDSKMDYEVALAFSLEFVFLHGYSQFINWRNFFNNKPDVTVAAGLDCLTY